MYYQNILKIKLLSFFFFLLCFSFKVYTQETRGLILDSKSKNPIPYAAIQSFSNGVKKLTLSGSNGKFILNVKPSPDSLIISSLGYRTVVYSSLKENGIFELEPQSYILNEVTVKPLKIKYIGFKPNLFGGVNNVSGKGLARISYIPNNLGKEAKIKQIIIHTNNTTKNDSNCYDLIRILVYKSNENNEPGVDLCPTQIYARKWQKKDKIMVEIVDYNILLPKEGVFLGYAYIGSYNIKNPDDVENCTFRSALKYKYINSQKLVSYIKNIETQETSRWQKVTSSNGKQKYFLFGINVLY